MTPETPEPVTRYEITMTASGVVGTTEPEPADEPDEQQEQA